MSLIIAMQGIAMQGRASILFLALFSTVTFAAEVRPVPPINSAATTDFEQAEFVLSAQRLPPGDDAPWEAVVLPDNWRRTRPGVEGTGWYRLKFHLDGVPANVHGVLVHHRRMIRLASFINGAYFGALTGVSTVYDFGIPTYQTIPPALLKSGENVLHIRVEASSVRNQGLSRVTVGGATPVRVRFLVYTELSTNAVLQMRTIALVAGMIALFVWLARRKDRVMLWYGIASLSWALAFYALWGLRGLDTGGLRFVLEFFVRYGMATTVVVLCLRTMEIEWRRFEALLWALMGAGFVFAFLGYLESDAANSMLWDLVYTVVPLCGLAIAACNRPGPLRWSDQLQGASLVLIAALNFHEAARYFGWVDVDSLYIRLYHVPAMLFATGAAIFERHFAAMNRMESINAELDERVRQKAAEIEAYHGRIEQAAREQALARERQRILEDMHDGLGASLISLLHHVQSGRLDAKSLEQRVQDALQEMRVAVDALQPRDGDLGAVLGSLRYRLEKTIASSGVEFCWEVDELPKVEALEPWAVLSIQRIVLEAITNAVRHSGAKRLGVAARHSGNELEVLIEDDGRGFDVESTAAGHGLRSMRARTERLGGRIEILSAQGGGTAVRLLLPLRLPQIDPRDSANAERGETFQPAPSLA